MEKVQTTFCTEKRTNMKKVKYYIGIDIASVDFTACAITTEKKQVFTSQKFDNTYDGFQDFTSLLSKNDIVDTNCIICMEATGVYGENLSYYLKSNDFDLSIEAPHKIKNATKDSPRKNDFIDALRIAQYACRFNDKLSFWEPKEEILEQIAVLLSTRQHLVEQLRANDNALKTIKRKYYQTPLANEVYQRTITEFKEHIKKIDNEIKKLVDKDDSFKKKISLAKSVPGVGLLLSAHLLVLTNGFREHLNYREIASYAGICPYEQTSGSSLNRKPRSKRCGPPLIRKLLYLASLSVRTHNMNFKKYFLRKVAEGKSKRLVLNNISNKILKILCAVVVSETRYIDSYKSINPVLLN